MKYNDQNPERQLLHQREPPVWTGCETITLKAKNMKISTPDVAVEQAKISRLENRSGATLLVRRTPPKPSPVFDTYWKFAAERQNIYFRRLTDKVGPWTADSVLGEYKFTNTYRAADRTSQYLIRNVIYSGTYNLRDTVLRVLLFKIFNKIETWELLESVLGEIREPMYNIDAFDKVLESAMQAKASIYSAAYIMPSGPLSIRQNRKHRMHLQLIADLLKNHFPERLSDSDSMQDAYELLVSIPSIGPFLAYQFVTDINYSSHFNYSEMEFVVPGPGAKDGIRKSFLDLGDYSEADAIRWVTERQAEEFEARSLEFKSLWGRPLQLIDCQNVFCEVDKYSRVAHPEALGRSGRTRIKQRFSPSLAATTTPWFPPKWNINQDKPKKSSARQLALHD